MSETDMYITAQHASFLYFKLVHLTLSTLLCKLCPLCDFI